MELAFKKLPVIVIWLYLILNSCSPKTEIALDWSEGNRAELEKVLKYYREVEPNELKLKAAEYLISNMLFQYTQVGPGVDSLNEVYRYVYGAYDKKRGDLLKSDSIMKEYEGKVVSEYDLTRISSHYLIGQIEAAFETYNRFDWCQDYSFDLFCEYILPFSMAHTDTVNWREYVLDTYGSMIDFVDFEKGNRYEAEDGRFKFSYIENVLRASESKVVRVLPGDSSSANIDFETSSTRIHRILISYFSGHQLGTNVILTLDDNILDTLLFPSTGSWLGLDKYRPPMELYIQMDAGIHTLKFTSLNKDIFVDYLEVPERLPVSLDDVDLQNGYYFLSTKGGEVNVREVDSLRNGAQLTLRKDKVHGWPIRLHSVGYGFYQLFFEKGTQVAQVLDAEKGKDKVILWNNYKTDNQIWALVPNENGGFQIRNKSTNQVLAYSKNKDVLFQSSPHNNGISTWLLEPVTDSISENFKSESKVIRVAKKISDFTDRFKWHSIGSTIGPLDPIAVIEYKYGTCGEETRLQTMMLRSFGVAATVDFVFNWAERGSGHSWSVIVDTDGSIIQNNCHHEVGSPTEANDFKKGKVYRQINSLNSEGLFLRNEGKELIPPQFNDPYFKDVTGEYCKVLDFSLDIEYLGRSENNYGYLMVRNYEEWVVTGWGERNDQSVIFENVEPYVVFLPTFYNADKNYQPINNPFYLDSLGTVHRLKADTNVLQNVVLKRKFPNRTVSGWHHRRIIGGKFQGANKSDFSDSVTIGVIDSTMLGPILHTINTDTSQKFNYLRYLGPKGGHCNINEILFFDVEGDTIKGEMIGTEANDDRTMEKAFDGDVLSYFDAKSRNEGWVGMKLKEPVRVNKIRFAARNDGNMIEVGNEYELVYWEREWKSMGKVKAEADSLVYENVPTGALYLLHNHTKGKEERIFTYEDGKQVWW